MSVEPYLLTLIPVEIMEYIFALLAVDGAHAIGALATACRLLQCGIQSRLPSLARDLPHNIRSTPPNEANHIRTCVHNAIQSHKLY